MADMQEQLGSPLDLSVAWLLPADPSCVSLARHATRRYLTSVGISSEFVDTAELLASELTSNVVKHAGRPTLRVVQHDDVIRIEVGDLRPGQLPVERNIGRAAESGRGLLLVSALATSWGYQRDGVRKLTRVELDASR